MKNELKIGVYLLRFREDKDLIEVRFALMDLDIQRVRRTVKDYLFHRLSRSVNVSGIEKMEENSTVSTH